MIRFMVWKFHVDWENPANTKVSGPDKVKGGAIPLPVRRAVDPVRAAAGNEHAPRFTGRQDHGASGLSKNRNRESVVAVHSCQYFSRAVAVSAGMNSAWTETATWAFTSRELTRPIIFIAGWAARRIDRQGNIGIGYSFGGSPNFAGQRFAGRLAKDPLGTLTLRENVLIAGEAPQNVMRWEDYTQTALDPSDDCTIWYVGDYLKKGETNYTSRIAGLRMPGCR
jgi:hypothetical protein